MLERAALYLVIDGLLATDYAPAVNATGGKCYVAGTARSPVGIMLGSHWQPCLEGRGLYSLAVQDALAAEHRYPLSREVLDLLADLEECFTWYATGHRNVSVLLDDFRIVVAAHNLTFPTPIHEVSHAETVAVACA
jgi:hypothetical protein